MHPSPSVTGVTGELYHKTITIVLMLNVRPAMLSRQVGGDGVGGVAVQAVAGVVVAAGGAGVFVADVVLLVFRSFAGRSVPVSLMADGVRGAGWGPRRG